MVSDNPGSRTLTLEPSDLPCTAALAAEVFAIGDVHGQAASLRACLQCISAVPKQPGSERVVIFLGDLIDRGSDSLGTIKLALDAQALTGADRCIILPGNHELMLLEVLDGAEPQPWFRNGGKAVMQQIDASWTERPWHEIRRRLEAGLPEGFADMMRRAPSHVQLGDLLFVHAGLDPDRDDAAHLDRDRAVDDRHWATIRNEALTWTGGWDRDPDTGARFRGPTVVVHGHTPAIRSDLAETAAEMPLMDAVDEHRAICLDAGASIRPQVGWARFFSEAGTVKVQIFATVTNPGPSRP